MFGAAMQVELVNDGPVTNSNGRCQAPRCLAPVGRGRVASRFVADVCDRCGITKDEFLQRSRD